MRLGLAYPSADSSGTISAQPHAMGRCCGHASMQMVITVAMSPCISAHEHTAFQLWNTMSAAAVYLSAWATISCFLSCLRLLNHAGGVGGYSIIPLQVMMS